ncbi:hypothetical protein EDD16DRAFT_1637046 [Pisolithus croceorrhizus]|nr:hypothetical protein EDD16DRAFT_1637046 [Pisolithus croceorrhizus]
MHRMASQPIVIAYVVFANALSADCTAAQSDGPSGVRENQRMSGKWHSGPLTEGHTVHQQTHGNRRSSTPTHIANSGH